MFFGNHFKNKNALVTGGSRGIGAEVVKKLSAHGARVMFSYLASEKKAAAVAKQVKTDFGIKPIFVQSDIGDSTEAVSLGSTAISQLGSVDILVLNAGISVNSMSWKTTPEQLSKVMSVNLIGGLTLAGAVAAHMREKESGRIVAVSSINGIRGKTGQMAYSASKGALIAAMKTMARELGRRNINVNTVAPGFIETDMTADLPASVRSNALEETVLRRLGTPKDVANVVTFLCSSMADHITGQVINVDGGQLIG